MTTSSIEELIRTRVEQGLRELPLHLREWAQAHLVSPRRIEVALDWDGNDWAEVWLVTDDVGWKDSVSQVVYDTAKECFGLVVRMANGVPWYMGPWGSFADAVDGM